MKNLLVIGIGNEHRGDDAAGILAARQLKTQSLTNVVVLEQNGDAAELMEAWKHANTVILIDAVSSGNRPGTILRMDPAKQSLSSSLFTTSTHALGVAEAIELSRALRQLPKRLILYGIEACNFDEGAEMSPPVKVAVKQVLEEVLTFC